MFKNELINELMKQYLLILNNSWDEVIKVW